LKITSNKKDEIEKLPEDVHTIAETLLARINSLPSLKYLTVRFWFDIYPEDPPVGSIRLPIMGQLENFDIFTLDRFSVILDSVVQYAAPNRNLKCISIFNYIEERETLATILQFGQEFAARFTTLCFDCPRLMVEDLSVICDRFTSLVYIEIP